MCVFFRCCCFRFVFVFDLSLFCWILFLYSLRIFESYKREFTKWLTAWFRFPDFSTTVLDSTRKNLHFHTSIYDKLIIFFFCPNFICFCFFLVNFVSINQFVQPTKMLMLLHSPRVFNLDTLYGFGPSFSLGFVVLPCNFWPNLLMNIWICLKIKWINWFKMWLIT